jgi:hypothetical protein
MPDKYFKHNPEMINSLVVAVMQPYFFPYPGYYRLFACVDLFVILDCVQFPRRGRVHRCEVPGPSGQTEWLTLPLARQPRDVLIRDLAFAANAGSEFVRRLSRHRWFTEMNHHCSWPLRQSVVISAGETVVSYLATQLAETASVLGLECQLLRSSELDIPPGLRGQDRIIAIAKHVGAAVYVNSPGGKAFYDPAGFAAAGMRLAFLPPWQGDYRSVLPALLSEKSATLRQEICGQSRFRFASAPATYYSHPDSDPR